MSASMVAALKEQARSPDSGDLGGEERPRTVVVKENFNPPSTSNVALAGFYLTKTGGSVLN
jgi:hypothetical protein